MGFSPPPQTLQHLLQQGWYHSRAVGLSSCWASLLWNHSLQQRHMVGTHLQQVRQHKGMQWGQSTPGREEHIPWHLARAALHSSCAWHAETGSERKAAAHKVVISPPRLLLPHVGFHSISIASQQLHTQHLFYHKTRSLALDCAAKLNISGRSPWSQCWSYWIFLLNMWVSKWNCLPRAVVFLLHFYSVGKKKVTAIAVLSSSFPKY